MRLNIARFINNLPYPHKWKNMTKTLFSHPKRAKKGNENSNSWFANQIAKNMVVNHNKIFMLKCLHQSNRIVY
jgi:hypothetical protein